MCRMRCPLCFTVWAAMLFASGMGASAAFAQSADDPSTITRPARDAPKTSRLPPSAGRTGDEPVIGGILANRLPEPEGEPVLLAWQHQEYKLQ